MWIMRYTRVVTSLLEVSYNVHLFSKKQCPSVLYLAHQLCQKQYQTFPLWPIPKYGQSKMKSWRSNARCTLSFKLKRSNYLSIMIIYCNVPDLSLWIFWSSKNSIENDFYLNHVHLRYTLMQKKKYCYRPHNLHKKVNSLLANVILIFVIPI
jgi:hypothetical protein